MHKLFTVLIILLLFFSQNLFAQTTQTDILFVLDNSGSMRKNDPELMTGKSVLNLIQALPSDSRVGVIIFDVKPVFAMPLTSVANQTFNLNVEKTLRKLSYTGNYTNAPIALEKAIYDLKQNGRVDAEKLIIFMTDGFIDTGDKKRDGELGKWLKEELTVDAKNSGIRIFSLAFTEEADFELIQTLAVKTGGGYFRAGKMEDLENVFSKIQHAILSPQSMEGTNGGSESVPMIWVVIPIAGFVILGIVVVIVRLKNDKQDIHKRKAGSIVVGGDISSQFPDAMLEDMDNVTGTREIVLSKPEMTIGRAGEESKASVDISIPQKTISALHATIEYRENSFFVTDRRSTNKTYLNNQLLPSDVAQRLKSGDIITVDKYKFRFIVKEQIGTSGTVFRPASAGGTVMRPQDRSQEQNVQQGIAMVDNDETRLKPGVCAIHPSYKATEVCPICKKGFCAECMVEKNGVRVCRQCADDRPTSSSLYD